MNIEYLYKKSVDVNLIDSFVCKINTVCPRSLDFYIGINYIKWAMTSWKDSNTKI